MRARYKIPLIVGIAIPTGFAAIFFIGPVLYMIVAGMIANFIISTTSDEAFEEGFARISEVKIFIEKYPDYGTIHYGDFLGWKVIQYTSEINDMQSIHMEVRKSVLHQKVKITAGCAGSDYSYVLDVPHDQVADFLQSDGCLGERK
ncbi:MAG: hypothetical protein J4F28_00190 [Nitrosopumilaceae archaeon]|nr:hypothetical protein [Nitrosopumilaceae archaeon]